MTTRNADVNLIVRARTEGEKAVAGLGDVLEALFDESRRGSLDIGELGKQLATLDKAGAAVAGSMDKAGAALDRQRAKIAANKDDLAALVAQQESAAAVIAKLQERLADQRADIDRQYRAPGSDSATAAQLSAALAEQARLVAQTDRLRDSLRTAEAQVQGSQSSLLKLAATSESVAQAQAEAQARIELNTQALKQQAAAAEHVSDIQRRINSTTGVGRTSATDAGATFSALTELVNKEHEAQAALRGSKAGAADIGLFGLKPYELQNLSYQVNDVVTGLASGQRLTQVIAQQGGQILQLFPKAAGSLIGALSNPAIAAGLVTIGAIALAMKRAADDAERLRTYTADTRFRADGGTYDPKQLAGAEEGLDRIGAKADDARAAVKEFLDDGINPALLEQFGRAAQETAEVLGIKLPDAAKQVADAFTGGYKAVADLDDKLNFLSASEREHIRTLFEEGNASAARTEALNAYTRQADAAAGKQRGPWGDAARSLGNAWHALLGYIADSVPVRATIAVLTGLAGAVQEVGDAIAGALGNDKPEAQSGADLARVQAQIATLKKDIDDYQAAIAKKPAIAGTLQRLVDESKRQLATAEAELARLEKSATDTQNSDPNSAAAKQRNDDLARIDREAELQRLRDAGQQRILTATEQARRAELAGQEAAKDAGDAVVAAALKRQAIAHETAQIEKETDARAKQAAADREREIRAFEGRVVGAEGGAGKNPYGSASGYGQFTRATFLNQFGKVFPEQASTLPQEQILALRQNEQVARAIIDNYARENAKFLESFGAKVTAGNLYLAHFLGAGGAKAVLTAPADRPVDQIIRGLPNAGAVLSGNQSYLRTDGGKGRYRTSAELQAFLANRVGDTGQAQTQGQEAIANLIQEATNRQNDFNQAVRHGNEDRQRGVDALKSEVGLYGTALLAEQRRQAVVAAEQELRQKAEDANKNRKPGETEVVVTDEQVSKAKELAAALFDAQHARDALNARLADAQRPVDDLTNQRDLLKEQSEFLRSIGENNQANAVDKQVLKLGTDIGKAYDALIRFYEALTPTQRTELGIVDQAQLNNLITKLKQAKQASQDWGKVLGIGGQQVAQAFAGAASTALTNFIQKVASGKNVFKSLGEGVKEFAANFITAIAQALVQLLAFAAAVQVLRNLGLTLPTGISVGQNHTGGLAGGASGGVRRQVSPFDFMAALRYHDGGIAGLRPNEVATVLERGEEVLTTSDPRHRFNLGAGGGGSSGSSGGVKIVNVYNPADVLQSALADSSGQRVLLNHVSSNKRAWKAALQD